MENIQQPIKDQEDEVITSAKSSSNKKRVGDTTAMIYAVLRALAALMLIASTTSRNLQSDGVMRNFSPDSSRPI